MLRTQELRWFHPEMMPTEIAVKFEKKCLLDVVEQPEKPEYLCLYTIRISQG